MKKWENKFIAIFTVVFMLLTVYMISCEPVSAYSNTDIIKWTDGITDGAIYFDASTGTITGCDDSTSVVEIPDEINGIKVTKIGNNAFYNCDELKDVSIPDSVESIGDYAFFACGSLRSIIIPKGVISIGNSAFRECNSLTSIKISDNVTSIGEYAFFACTCIEDIYISSIEAWIEIKFSNEYSNPMYYADNLYLKEAIVTELEISRGVTSIGDYVFYDCDSLRSIIIPEGVRSIGDYAFYKCDNLRSIIIPEGVESIGYRAFFCCDNIRSIIIPESVISIGDYAFYISDENTCIILECYPPSEVTNAFWGFYGIIYYPCDSILWDYREQMRWCVTGTWKKKHGSGEFNIIEEATCTKVGLKETICSLCGELVTEEIEKTEHEWEDEYTVDQAPTCTEDGSKSIHCQKCEAVKESEVLPALGHEYVKHEAKEATCTEDGWKEYQTCSRCEYTTYEPISAIGHKPKAEIVKATTTQNGTMKKCCQICGEILPSTTIPKVSSMKLSSSAYTYTGGIKTPAVTVKDAKGKTLTNQTDYTVTYASERKVVGTYKVTVTLIGNYSGSQTLSFKIIPKGTSISSLNRATKAVTVKWKKQSTQTSGYQILYSTNKKFTSGNKYVTIKSNKTTAKKITKLKAKKKYYVKVRTYKLVNGVRYYSNWSSVKSVITK